MHLTKGGEIASGHVSPHGQHNSNQHGPHSDGHDGHHHHRHHSKRDSKTSGDCTSQDAATEVLDLLELLYKLLGLHEVRLAIQLLEDWSTLPFAASALSVTREELHFCIESFVRRQWSSRSAGGDAGLAMLQGYGDGHATPITTSQAGSNYWYSEEEVAAKRVGLQHTLDKQRQVMAARAAAALIVEAPTAAAASEETHTLLSRVDVPRPPAGDEAASRNLTPKILTEASKAPTANSPAKAAVSSTSATIEAAGERLSEMVQNRVDVSSTDVGSGSAAEKEDRDFETQESSSGDYSPRSITAFHATGVTQVSPSIMSSPEQAPPVLCVRAEQMSRQITPMERVTDNSQAAGVERQITPIQRQSSPVPRGNGPPLPNGGAHETDAMHNTLSLPGVASHSLAVGSSISNGFSGLSLPLPMHGKEGRSGVQGVDYTNIMRASGSTEAPTPMSRYSCDISMGPATCEPSMKSALNSSAKEVIESCQWSVQPALTRILKSDDSHKSSRSVDEFLMSMPSHMLMVHPSGSLRISWDVLALVFLIYESVALPLGFAFDLHSPDWLQWMLTLYFSADCLLNCLTGYFMDGALIMKQKLVVRHYARTWLIIDLIATFPWFAISNFRGTLLRWLKVGRILRMMRLLRVAKLSHLMHQIEDSFYTSQFAVVLKLLRIICVITLFCHWCACVWAWLGGPDFMETTGGPNDRAISELGSHCEGGIIGSPWRRRYGLEAEPVLSQYLISLRFATGVFTGSDIGIQPGYSAERLFVILTTLMSFVVLSLAISRVVVMFNKISLEHAEQEDILVNVKEFMAAGQVPLSLQSRVKRYLEYQFVMKRHVRVQHFELLEKLSPWLRAELQAHVNQPVLVQHPVFRRMPRDVLAQCCCIAEAMSAAPDDIVLQKGQVCSNMYFLVRGKLHISSEEGMAFLPQQTEMPARKLLALHLDKFKGDVMRSPGFIGASCLFKEHVLSHTVSAATHSELLKLSKEDLDILREEFPSLRNVMDTFSKEQETLREGLVDCSLRLHSEQAGEWTVW